MKREQCLALLVYYKRLLKERGAKPIEIGMDVISPSKKEMYNNALFMVMKMPEFLEQGKIDKFDRWLGFLQCILLTYGEFSMNQLREHNRHQE